MRKPRPRLTIRRLMVAVAMMGVMLGLVVGLWHRSENYRRGALTHAGEALLCEDAAWGVVRMTNGSKEEAASQAGALLLLKAHHEAMREKYERAARHPWLPVAPDPPEPKASPCDRPESASPCDG